MGLLDFGACRAVLTKPNPALPCLGDRQVGGKGPFNPLFLFRKAETGPNLDFGLHVRGQKGRSSTGRYLMTIQATTIDRGLLPSRSCAHSSTCFLLSDCQSIWWQS